MLERPTAEYVRARIPQFSDYADADAAIELVFSAWPRNDQMDQVLAKVVTLNRLYSTSIFDVHGMARHIIEQSIDEDLRAGNPKLVSRVAMVNLSNGKTRNNFSFATKYCAWHEPERFQIYDSRVECALWAYQKQFSFGQFRRYELWEYPSFIRIVDAFVDYFCLHDFSRKQLDKFLWLEGRSL